MSDKPTLSVVIPTYNEENIIAACLNELLKQVSEIAEIVIVNNNSNDRTVEIVREIQKTAPQIKVVDEFTPGLMAARSAGFSAATSDLLARIDADSIVQPNWAANIRNFFSQDKNKSVMAASGPTYFYDAPLGKIIEPIWTFLIVQTNKVLAGTGELFGSNMVLRRETWQAIKNDICHNGDIMEDLDLSIHIERHKMQIGFIAKSLVGISARRQRMSPLRFWQYQAMWANSYSFHNMKAQAVAIWAVAILGIVIQVIIWLPLRAFDPVTRHFSIKLLLAKQEERILPKA